MVASGPSKRDLQRGRAGWATAIGGGGWCIVRGVREAWGPKASPADSPKRQGGGQTPSPATARAKVVDRNSNLESREQQP